MTSRTTRNGVSTEVSWPDVGSTEGFGNEYARHIRNLYRYAILPLSGVSGADTITASVEPSLATEGLLSGMKFSVVWAEDSTGPATLNVDGQGDASILSADGSEMEAGDLVAGVRAILEYDGSDFRLLGGTASSSGGSTYGRQVFTTAGTWVNPGAGMVLISLVGGGGSGAVARSAGGTNYNAGGGQGGAYVCYLIPASLLPATVAVSVGDGGASRVRSSSGTTDGANGGETTFGDFAAPGGIGGSSLAGGSGASTPFPGIQYLPGGTGGDNQDAPEDYNRGTGGGGGASSGSDTDGAGASGNLDLGDGGDGSGNDSGSATAVSGSFPGGGGGGAGAGSGTATSGAGAPGRVTVDVWG